MTFTKTGVNQYGAVVGNLKLFDQNKSIASGTGAFSGGADPGHGGIPNGGFMMRLDIRGEAGPGDVRPVPGGFLLKPFAGVQSIPKELTVRKV